MIRKHLFKGLLTVVCGSVLVYDMLGHHALAGGLGGRRGGGGGGNFSGAAARPSPRPGMSSMPSRPSMPQMPVSRPQASVPHLGGNTMTRPGMTGNMSSRPAPKLPNNSRPNNSLPGGLSPSNKLPGTTSPSNRLPGNVGNGNAGLGGSLPGNKLPSNKLPGTTLPSNKLPGNNSPGNRLPGSGVTGGLAEQGRLPDFSKLPQGRPSTADLGNYLGLDRPVRPETKPAQPVRPTPSRPNGNRPPVNLDNINLGNNLNLNSRPDWVNINQNQIIQINQQWQSQLGNLSNWQTNYPARGEYFHRWGNDLRRNWVMDPGFYGPQWWNRHPFHCSGWHYFHVYWNYPYSYWWSTPSYNQLAQWLAWSAVANQPQQPVYYDYGTGGNVTYQDNRVYMAGQPIASSDEFAASAATLATVDAPKSDEQVKETEWLPLGTFALTTSTDDLEPNQIVQLAVDKSGVIAGTLHDKSADTTVALQGRVDKDTQRVAVRVGDSDRVVAETGLYNLTQDEASVLIHFGNITQDNYLLVRLPDPESKPGNSKQE